MNVQEFYAAIGGDYKTAVARMMNDDFIKRMLGKFQANNSFDALLTAYKAKDAKALFEAANT